MVETQLTRQQAPVVSGWGQTGKFLELPAALAIYREPDVGENRLAAHRGLSFMLQRRLPYSQHAVGCRLFQCSPGWRSPRVV